MPRKLDQEICKELVENANKIASPGRGILAADESTGTIGKRFDSVKVENNEENRAFYRGLLFSTKGLGEYISGAILFEETLYQKDPSGKLMTELLAENNILPGIKVDKGLVDLWGTDGEKSTQGLDGLAQRCAEYYKAGARFAKWRCVLNIDGDTKPSDVSIKETAWALGRYASICQANRLVPIVEPEIMNDGTHDIHRCAEATERVLAECFKALADQHVLLEGCLLKPNMVTPGAEGPASTNAEIGYLTVRTLQRTVPPALVGVMFLSGGQAEEDASLNLNVMNAIEGRKPWKLSFSYGRALQATVLKTWGGNPANKDAAQAALLSRAKANSEAQLGTYAGSKDGAGKESLYVKGYVY